MSDAEKKISILKYLVKTQQRMLRLNVLAQWCQQVPLIQYCQQLASTLSSHETCFTQAADSVFFMHEGLQQARAPIYEVPSAIEVLLTGTYQCLPKCTEDVGIQSSLTEKQQKPVLKKLDTRDEIGTVPVPNRYRYRKYRYRKHGKVGTGTDTESIGTVPVRYGIGTEQVLLGKYKVLVPNRYRYRKYRYRKHVKVGTDTGTESIGTVPVRYGTGTVRVSVRYFGTKRSSLLDTIVRSKLLETTVPKEFSEVKIADGTVSLCVPGEFKVLLTLGYRGHLSMWRILHLEVLVGEKSGLVKLEETRRLILGDDIERRMAACDTPFAILYSILHEFCVALIMDTVMRQVREIG
ncbi:hypothetical protein QVD17_27002 [Tagetes erecta]|uniref:Mediator of RNA polymerase II transcription subunit 14 n=1 Tax=Tagetes erecta TaxID=13708 RepID=A0AAD8K8B2_TARER|nr:hypothetical protein QVD17_27002 [Tagetes erecta]